MFITQAEEKALGVGEKETKAWRDENEVPNTEGLLEMHSEELGEKEKRSRSDTVSTSHSQNSDFNNTKRPHLDSISDA